MADFGGVHSEYISKYHQVTELGKKVFGSKDKFTYWLSNKKYVYSMESLTSLSALEEILIQIDEGYCL